MRLKVLFGWHFYVPLAVLHASQTLRLTWGRFGPGAFAVGATGNGSPSLLFALIVGGTAVAWRIRCVQWPVPIYLHCFQSVMLECWGVIFCRTTDGPVH